MPMKVDGLDGLTTDIAAMAAQLDMEKGGSTTANRILEQAAVPVEQQMKENASRDPKIITDKLHRDRAEVEEIEAALEYIRGDKNYEVIPMTYFERKNKEEICAITGVSSSTLWRICCRLIRDLELVLYGASALK